MNRRFLFTTGTIGAFALLMAGTTVDLHAQRGAGIGHASVPTNVGQGRPATAGRPDLPALPVSRPLRASPMRRDDRQSPISSHATMVSPRSFRSSSRMARSLT
jgi:hypothetical protein